MFDHFPQFGFAPEESKAIVGIYQDARGGGAVGRTDFLIALQTQLDGLEQIVQLVDENKVAGDAYENLTRLDNDRAFYLALIDKISSLSDQQIADLGICCLKFWEQRPPPNI